MARGHSPAAAAPDASKNPQPQLGNSDCRQWGILFVVLHSGAVATGAKNLVVVGTAWASPSGYSRAFRQEVTGDPDEPATYPKAMFNLNDPHWSYIPAGWTLLSAEDLNGWDWIVGLATDASGYSRGYVLVPQPTVGN